MGNDLSIWTLVLDASVIVQAVMVLLLAASVASWAVIFKKSRVISHSRRQADQFVDIIELQNKIGRDPGERPMREPREPREAREPRHTPQFLQRSPTSQRVEVEDEFEED